MMVDSGTDGDAEENGAGDEWKEPHESGWVKEGDGRDVTSCSRDAARLEISGFTPPRPNSRQTRHGS